MAIAFVQARATDAGGSGGSLAFSSNVTAGSLLLAHTVTDTGATPTISDSQSQTWTAVDAKLNAAHSGIRLFYAQNALSGATTITLAGSSAGWGLVIAEFSAVATSGALDGALHGTLTPPGGTAASPQGNAFTPSANDLAVGYYGDFGTGCTFGAASGWSIAAQSNTGNGYGCVLIYQILTTSTSVTAGWTGSTDSSGDEAVGWAAFVAAAGGASDPFPAGYGYPGRLGADAVYRI